MLFALLKRSMAERLSSNRAEKQVIISAPLFAQILRSALTGVPVDEEWYLAKNPDVKDVVESGQLVSGKQHFIERGYFEDRLPFPIKVNEDFYLNSNPDVRAALECGEIESAQCHFDDIGYREGRQPSDRFSFFGVLHDKKF